MNYKLPLLAMALSGLLDQAAQAQNAPTRGDLYYTRFCGTGARVRRTTFVFDGTTFTLGARIDVAFPPGADGIVFAPDLDLLVGGQGNALHKIDRLTGSIQTQSSGGIIYHVMLDPDQDRVWGAGLPGQLSEFSLNPFGPGTVHSIVGDDNQVVQVTWAGSTAFYTRSNPSGLGNFGTIDMSTFQTTRYLTNIAGAHGMAFDSRTGDLFLFGANSILQIDPQTPTVIKSSLDLSGSLTATLDQGTVDGRGHAFIAENGGKLVFIDYSASGLIGGTTNFVSVQHLDDCLDDIAPLSGPGSQPECHTLSFDTEDDFSTPLVNGQHINAEFGRVVTITSSGPNAGLGIFDSTVGGPNDPSQDPDLLIGTGNLLILQTTNLPPDPNDIYPRPNDDSDGGTITFSFPGPIEAGSVRLVDLDLTGAPNRVVLTDEVGRQRTYSVPSNWTGDRTQAQPGQGTLDLGRLDPQPGYAATATASEASGFDPRGVRRIEIILAGSGAVDDLSWCAPGTALASAAVTRRRGTAPNPVKLRNWTLPVVGGTWVTGIDCSGHASGNALLGLYPASIAPITTPFGQLMVGGNPLLLLRQPHGSSLAYFNVVIPPSMALSGLRLHAQGACTGLPGPRLSNALDFTVGF